jgi:hypothetical protein
VRTLAGLMAMVLLALLVAACGDEDESGDATEEATTVSAVTTEAAEEPTEIATEPGDASTPVSAASPATLATPAIAVASPVAAASPVGIASPVAMATPESSDAAVAPVTGSAESTPADETASAVTLSGEVTLPGTAGETFVIAAEGCVGLNGYSDMRAGRQLVVRDETGTIIGVTEIEASDATDACSWTFSVEVPESHFYAVSIPMEVEHVYTHDEVEADGGEIEVPLG